MLHEIKLPELGENITGGTVVSILVKPGDAVEENQTIMELETDKAVIEVPGQVSGIVKDVPVPEGDEVKVGQLILTVDTQGSAAEESVPQESQPQQNETPAEGAESPPKVSEETATVPPPLVENEEAAMTPAVQEVPDEDRYIAPAAPSVRRFAREIGVHINQVKGSGPGGRISVEDVKAYAKMINQQKQASAGLLKGVQDEPLPDFGKWGEVDVQPMNKIREKTAQHLSYAWATIPHVTQFDKADITELEKIRKQYGGKAEQLGAKLTVTAILLKVVEKALKKFPAFNASIDMVKKEVIYKKYVNIGVAVDTEHGLLVPVIKNVDQKNILQLAQELGELSAKARNRKLSLEDMQGGNFSISNLGGIGGTGFTPVVNAPEVAILGVSRASFEPVYREGEFVPRLMLPLSLSYDHRLIDGADAARFLRWVCRALEQPFLLALEG